jgi:hypothetical protein
MVGTKPIVLPLPICSFIAACVEEMVCVRLIIFKDYVFKDMESSRNYLLILF